MRTEELQRIYRLCGYQDPRIHTAIITAYEFGVSDGRIEGIKESIELVTKQTEVRQ